MTGISNRISTRLSPFHVVSETSHSYIKSQLCVVFWFVCFLDLKQRKLTALFRKQCFDDEQVPPKKVRAILFTTLSHFIVKAGQIICIDILFFWSVMMSTNEKKQGHMQNQIRVHSGSLKNPLRSGLKNKKTETDSLNDLTCLTEKLHTLRLISNLYSHLKSPRYSFILLLLFVIFPSDYCCKTT